MADDYRQHDVNRVPRFANVATFLRAPQKANATGLDIALAGVPFDLGSSFRSGARHGPAQVREMSRLIKQFNYSTKVAPFELCRIADVGDAPVNSLDIEASLGSIQAFFEDIVADDAVPLAVGGDHTISLPILRALAKRGPVGLVQIDAHSDTMDQMLGKKYANGTPFRRAIEEGLVDPKRTVQIGIRGTLFRADELTWASEQGVTIISTDDFYDLGVEEVAREARGILADEPAYLTFDIDVLDPAYAPGTGGLEIGGLTTRDAQLLLRGMYGLIFVGADINEIAPPLDPTGNTALVAANIMFEELCLLADSIHRRRADP
jgi:guanidinopropionase